MLLVDFTQNAYAQAWAWKGMPMHHVLWQTKLHTELAHFVLEQFAQRLQKLQLHVLSQTAHIVVRLDDVRFTGFVAGRFYSIGIIRPDREPLHNLELRRLLVEDFHEH